LYLRNRLPKSVRERRSIAVAATAAHLPRPRRRRTISPMAWSRIVHPLWLTAWVAGLATLIGVVVGTSLAYVVARKRFRGRELIDTIILLPLALPPTVLGYYLLVVVGQRSVIGQTWSAIFGAPLVFTPAAAVLAACMHTVPMIAKSMRGAFALIDPTLEDMARTDGAAGLTKFREVYLPQVMPPLTAVATMAFARAVGDFGVTLMVAGNIPGQTQTASIAIYDLMMAGRQGEALVLTIVVSAASLLVIWLSTRAGESYHHREP
jgi:molybdate transport system permease protein